MFFKAKKSEIAKWMTRKVFVYVCLYERMFIQQNSHATSSRMLVCISIYFMNTVSLAYFFLLLAPAVGS